MEIKNYTKYLIIGFLVFGFILSPSFLQAEDENKAYQFTVTHEVKHTPVKDQARTGTCWCFSTVSFMESEAMRLGADAMDLSEMFIVNYNYRKKAENYVRMHGTANFGQGSLSHDAMGRFREKGIVPESVYDGLRLGKDYHDHSEMFRVLKGIVDGVVSSRRPTIQWKAAFEGALNAYLGTPPESFEYEGQTFTPHSFAEEKVLINPDHYVELTSYTYAPFYDKCVLRVPDNWIYNDDFYNVPLDDLEKLVDYALENGFSVVWDGDVSEKTFSSRDKGYAILPEKEVPDEITEPVEEMEVTQANRQETFDSYTTTDDHLMHIVGLAKDQNGSIYYYIKNSGGVEGIYDGYLFMSKPYFRMKTTAVMVHQDALPPALKQKLDLPQK
ncbi:MAG TPA: C1 family peptidase [Acidobacteriota bacterium]|nr:C1 family peptidase [Acidobacteriota bacterium]